jgi:hypothetical protein
MKEGIWQINLAILAILVIVIGIFAFPKISEAGESFNGNIRGMVNSFFPTQEQKDARDKFENYFVDFKDEVYKECMSSSEKNCWCTKGMFELTNGFDLRIKKEGETLRFDFFDGIVDFDKYQFQKYSSCLVTEQGDFSINELVDEEFRIISKGDSAILKFELKEPVGVATNLEETFVDSVPGELVVGLSPNPNADSFNKESEFENEIDLSLMFFKIANGNVCIIDKVRADEYKDLKAC